jgi:pimeloyl-ACP methyl ester carboxylesterase/DNA-binding winged helix-turn-helix (wHTH) protein
MTLPPVRFVTAPDGVRLAYAVYGKGPPLVWVANWLTHLELDFESPVWRHWIDFFSRHFTLIRYDERGCGLSDRLEQGFDLETWVGDLAAVIGAVGLDQFDLLGLSQGGPIGIEYSVRNPGRVKHLVLMGTYSDPSFLPDAERTALATLIETGWGRQNPAFRQLFTSFFIPDASEEQQDWFNRLQAQSTKPAIAAALMRAFRKLDVRARLPLVTTPTMIIHSRRDAAIPIAAGRAVAAGIRDARFVTLESSNHIPLVDDPGWPVFCREVLAFCGAEAGAADSPPSGASGKSSPGYTFGRCRLDTGVRELVRDDAVVPMENRAFDMLVYLLEHRDRAISKDELQEAIWPRMILTESALTRCVMKVRRAVGDDPQRQDVIKTIHGHGYRFVANVAPNSGAKSP